MLLEGAVQEIFYGTMILSRMEKIWARDKWLSGAAGRWKLGVQKAILKARRSQAARTRARRGLRQMDERQATGSKLSLGYRIWELEIMPEAAAVCRRGHGRRARTRPPSPPCDASLPLQRGSRAATVPNFPGGISFVKDTLGGCEPGALAVTARPSLECSRL